MLEEFADLLLNARHLAAAAHHYQTAADFTSTHFGKTHRQVARVLGRLALVQAAAQDTAGYRETCQDLSDRFGESQDPLLLNLIAWTSCLLPDGVSNWSRIVEISERAVAADPQNHSLINTLGVALFRAGRNDEALDTLQKAINISDSDSDLMDRLFVAMIYAQMGRSVDALSLFQAVEEEIKSPTNSDDQNAVESHAIDAIEREMFLAEAKVLLGRGDER
jgi:tetratricopeptide (TPR) repeat protein